MDQDNVSVGGSPVKKKRRCGKDVANTNEFLDSAIRKRPADDSDVQIKRRKHEPDGEILPNRNRSTSSTITNSQKRFNFISACQHVANKEYINATKRFGVRCIMKDDKNEVFQVSGCKQEAFNIDYNSHMWCEALDVCRDIISYNVYLSADIMQNICEIIMNAHETKFDSYSIKYILNRSRHILNLNFNTHLCHKNTRLRKCFQQFLVKPLQQKDGSFSDRDKYACESGIFKYCIRRIQKEIDPNVGETAIVDKFVELPPNVGTGVQQIHWQRDKFEILETLVKSERLERLFVILNCLTDLLEKDFNIWFQRHSSNLVGHIMKTGKPLMAFLMWDNNSLLTGSVSLTCKQIFMVFANLIEYEFHEKYISVFSRLLNLTAELMTICEKSENDDYPVIGKYIKHLTLEFYTILQVYSNDTIVRVLKLIKTPSIKFLLGEMLLEPATKAKASDTLTLVKIILKDYNWSDDEIKAPKKTVDINSYNITVDRLFKDFRRLLKCKTTSEHRNITSPPKKPIFRDAWEKEHLVDILVVTLRSYIETYALLDIHTYQEYLNTKEIIRNENTAEMSQSEYPKRRSKDIISRFNNRQMITKTDNQTLKLSENSLRRYREIFKTLKEVIKVFKKFKESNPDIVKHFTKIKLLEID